MGKQYGGTAGGGKSDRHGNVTYSRVVPKFLRKHLPNADADPLDAKRGNPTSSSPTEVEEKPKLQSNSKPSDEEIVEELEKLKAEGFNVVVEESNGVDRNPTEQVDSVASIDTSKPKYSSMKKTYETLHVKGKIEKKKTVKNTGKMFATKNKRMLSFANSDSEDSD